MQVSEKVLHRFPGGFEHWNRLARYRCRELDDLTAEVTDRTLVRLGLGEALVRSRLDLWRL